MTKVGRHESKTFTFGIFQHHCPGVQAVAITTGLRPFQCVTREWEPRGRGNVGAAEPGQEAPACWLGRQGLGFREGESGITLGAGRGREDG
jgi:hypothetical protein